MTVLKLVSMPPQPASVHVVLAAALPPPDSTTAWACRLVATKSTLPPDAVVSRRKSSAIVEARQRLVEVDDVHAVALAEQEALHARVPAARLVAEVTAGLDELADAERLALDELPGHATVGLGCGLALLGGHGLPLRAPQGS